MSYYYNFEVELSLEHLEGPCLESISNMTLFLDRRFVAFDPSGWNTIP